MATPPRLIAIQHVDPSPRDVFIRRASAASALHGETTRSTLNPAAVSGSTSSLTRGVLAARAVGQPPDHDATPARQPQRTAGSAGRARENASIPGNAAGSRISAAVRRISPPRTEVRAKRTNICAELNSGNAAHLE